jgi:hypothetical protein
MSPGRLFYFVPVLLFLAVQLIAQGQQKEVILQAKQYSLTPEKGVIYMVSGGPLYHSTNWPGPQLRQLNVAWQFANEFVYRTNLRDEYELPSLTSYYDEKSKLCYIEFKGKTGVKPLTVAVNSAGKVWITEKSVDSVMKKKK